MTTRQTIIVLSALLLCSLVGVGFAKREGIKHRISVWRASSLTEKAVSLREEGKWGEAFETSLAAWQLDQGNITIFRELYGAAKAVGSPQILSLSSVLFAHPESTLTEKVEVIRLYLRMGDHVTVASLLAQLTPEERDAEETLAVGVEFLLARNQVVEALRILENLRSVRDKPTDLYLTALALARIESEGDRARQEAQRLIDDLVSSEREVPLALSSFLILDSIPEASWDLERFAGVDEELAALVEGEDLPVAVQLLQARLHLARQPDRKHEILSQIVERLFASDKNFVADWFIRIGETSYVLEALLAEGGLADPNSYTLLIKCFFRDGEWKKAEALLEEAPDGLNPATMYSLQAIVAAATGNAANSANWWERAMRQAKLASGRNDLMSVARLAASMGNEKVRNEAVTEALQRPSLVPIPAADVSFIFSHLVDEGADQDLLEISLGMLRREPNNPLLVNNVAWLTLMNGRSAAGLKEKLAEFVEKFPSVAALRTTLALSYYREGKRENAVRVLREWLEGADPESLSVLSDTDIAVIRMIDPTLVSSVSREQLRDPDFSNMMAIERDFFEAALLH